MANVYSGKHFLLRTQLLNTYASFYSQMSLGKFVISANLQSHVLIRKEKGTQNESSYKVLC